MYYSNGNYEAFARPKKPQDVENKSAYLVGSGLASLSAALFLVRDAQMPGERIHILEELELPGGSLDGILDNTRGYIMRGGREMENHFECLWDLFRSVPSLEVKDASVLDEFYWLNKEDPNFSKMRATMNRGKSAHTDGKFTLTDKAAEEIARLFLTSEEELNDKRISDVFSEEFFQSNFWLYWRTMFAFEEWHSAMEMRRYIARFIHHIGGLPDLSALKFTRYNQYESLVMPLVKHLESKGVRFEYGVQVKNVIVSKAGGKKTATKIVYEKGGREGEINLTENDLVFVTNGSITENSTYGDQNTVPVLDASLGGSWSLWTNIAVQDPAFGKPEKFCGNIKESNFVSATLTTLDGRIPPYIERICQRDPFAGKVVTGGIVSVKDSSWLMSLDAQPPAAVQETAGERTRRVDIRPLFQPSGRLREEADEGLYRHRDSRGVALPHRGAVGRDTRYGGQFGQYRPLHDALCDVLLHAACAGRPSGRCARRFGEPCVHRQLRRDAAGYGLHYGVFRAYGHGGGLYAVGRRPRCTGSLRFVLRCAHVDELGLASDGRQETRRHQGAVYRETGF